MNKFKYHFFWWLIFLWTIIIWFYCYSTLIWTNIPNVNTETPMTANLWNNTMTNIVNNVNSLETKTVNIENNISWKNKMVWWIRQYVDSSFDCTFSWEFPNWDTSFKYNLWNWVYMCQYMFYVWNANNESDFLRVCPSKWLNDAWWNKFALSWRKDPTTWWTMWRKAKNTSPAWMWVFIFFNNVWDWNWWHHIGVNLIFHSSQVNNVLPQHWNYTEWSTRRTPASLWTQRTDYSTYWFIMCEL